MNGYVQLLIAGVTILIMTNITTPRYSLESQFILQILTYVGLGISFIGIIGLYVFINKNQKLKRCQMND